MEKAIVSGAAGFLGYHLVNELVGRGVMVYAVYRPGSANLKRLKELKNITLIPCALNSMDKLPEQFAERDFDVFFHLAWQGASGKERQDSQLQAENIKWTLDAVKAAARLGCRKFVAAGTVCENQCEVLIKKGLLVPSAYYLLAKESAYKMSKMECIRQGISFVWCTFYHPIGRYNKSEQIIADTVLKLLRKEEPVFGPADQWFDVIAAKDLSRGFYLAGKKSLKNDRYFIGSGAPRRLREYLEGVKAFMKSDVPLKFCVYPDDGLPVERSWLDIAPFCEETGFYSKMSFEESVKELFEWIYEIKIDDKSESCTSIIEKPEL